MIEKEISASNLKDYEGIAYIKSRKSGKLEMIADVRFLDADQTMGYWFAWNSKLERLTANLEYDDTITIYIEE